MTTSWTLRMVGLLAMSVFFAAMTRGEVGKEIRTDIAKDILSRMERDFFHYDSQAQNVSNILRDCVFEETDLTGHGTNEVVVKINWFSDGRFGISMGHNYVRGAQNQGDYYVYSLQAKKLTFLGVIQGNNWKLLSPKSMGWKDIETGSHEACDKEVVNQYRYSKGQYWLVSSILYQYFYDDRPRKALEVFK